MPRAPLGQHFLHDRSALRTIAVALALAPGDTIIEIGAGHGELTEELLALSFKLLESPAHIIAVEKDPKLASSLKLSAFSKKIEIIEGDAREILPNLILKLTARSSKLSYKLCGNIPYYLTGFLLRLVGELVPLPARTVFTIQKEVAERIAAEPPRMNPLAASVQFWAKPKILGIVPRSAFVPPPEVDSAIISLETQDGAPAARTAAATYYAAVHALFRQPRKTLLNNIVDAAGLPKNEAAAALEKMGIGSTARPHNLSLAQISALAAAFTFLTAKKSPRGAKERP